MKIKEMKEIIKADKETKDIELEDRDVIKVFQYLKDRDSNRNYDGYIPRLRTTPYIEIFYEATQKTLDEQHNNKIKEHMKLFDCETYIQDASLERVKKDSKHRIDILNLVNLFISEYKEKGTAKGLYIYGPYNSGKSYLLSAIAKELSRSNYEVIFAYMPDISRGIKQSIDEGTLEKRINVLKQTNILILDDFGAEYISDWFRDDVLMPIIQYRQSARLPIFVSSNYSISEITEVLASTNNRSSSVKAARLTNRLIDMMNIVKLY